MYQAPPTGYAPPTTYGVPVASSSRPSEPDSYGLSAAITRLNPTSRDAAGVAFSVAGALLQPSERVLGAVAGSSLGMPTVVVVTEHRALIISDRRYVPDVELFDLGPGLTIYGRHANGQASLTFGDGERLVTVDQITDVGVAVELAGTARTRTSGSEF